MEKPFPGMVKKHPAKLIAGLSFIMGIGGIVNDLFFSTHDINLLTFKALANPVDLAWMLSVETSWVDGLNYSSGTFSVLMLLAAIIYFTSKYTASRLIRFLFSIIFFSNILSFVYTILYSVLIKSFFLLDIKAMLINILFIIVHIFWLFVSFRIVRYFDRKKELKKDAIEENGVMQNFYVNAPLEQRFINPIIDTLVAVLLFGPIMQLIIFKITNFHPDRFEWGNKLLPVLILFRIIYYLFYETILGITPGKLITGTVILDYNGDRPAFKNIFIRTIARLVPFEAFSFFVDDGWHDKWSDTVVVKEAQTEREDI